MFCLLYICKNAKEKENQTEINKSNQITDLKIVCINTFYFFKKLDRDNLQRRLDQYSLILRENCQSHVSSNSAARLQILIGSLIEQGMHHRDIVEGKCHRPSKAD